MGSSKKRKEHKRSRSRSKEKERKKRRHRDEEKRKSQSPVKEKKRKIEKEPVEEPVVGGTSGTSGNDISMSVDETNKLRAQLGLAPLQTEEATVKDVQTADGLTTERVVTVDGREFVHKPAENLSAKKESESIREKLQALRERRKLDEKLRETKLLGEEEEESAADWVAKSKRLTEERRLAELREKMLQEMDDQFGVSEMIDKRKRKGTSKQTPEGYSSKDLAGTTVQHSKESLLQSTETYLVLADKNVLDDSEDVLVNPTVMELEKWKKNAELRKKKTGYNPYEEELDEFGMPKRKMLSKYDEEIEGEKVESFKLGARGDADLTVEREREEMLAKLREGSESLVLPQLELAKEYLTNEEMVKFKKPTKRVRKVRKRAPELKADDLLTDSKSIDDDFGSRDRGRGRKRADYESGTERNVDMEKAVEDDMETEEPMSILVSFDDDPVLLSDDEADKELQAALARTRQLQLLQAETKKVGVEKVAELIPKTEEMEEDESTSEQGKIIMDSVSEYCRGLGDIPTYGMAGNREDVDEDEEMIDSERPAEETTSRVVEEEEEDEEEDEMESRGRWYERDINDMERPRSSASIKSESDELSREPILEDEPDMDNMGVAGALKVAMLKGYLKDEKGNRGSGLELDHLRAQRFTVVDKQFHDIDDKYAKKLERMGGSGGGPIMEFREKSEYKPDVKLEYSDEKGRLLDEKDAFRYLSWKFHGKAPGKKKVEKRNKKLLEKELFNEMNSTDTPLGTLSKQLEKQRQLQLPFIVLSGTGSKDVGTSIKKD